MRQTTKKTERGGITDENSSNRRWWSTFHVFGKSLAQSSLELGINQVIFMDNDPKKLNIYGKMAQQVAKRLQPDLQLELTGDPVEAIKDADYIITTIRVGEDDMRIQDERVALNLGVLGQETTGAAGFSFAMRSVPALVKYCELAKIRFSGCKDL